jgi:hypothetical protein
MYRRFRARDQGREAKPACSAVFIGGATGGLNVRLLPLVFLLSIQAGSSAVAPLTWWVANPLEKVKALDPAPSELLKSADLYAARNEFEPFQIVLRTDGADVPGIDVECSDLRTTRDGEIAKDNITIYEEQFMNITRPSSASGVPGLWPDALVPRIDRYAHERRNAFPFRLIRGSNQPLWIEIFVPAASPPGEYSGMVSVSREGKAEFSVPIHLTVWAFTLPSTSTLKSSFGLNGTAIVKQHRGRYTSDEDLYSLTRDYARAALLHRISVHGGSMVPPKHEYTDGRVHLDWSAYDAEVGPFLDGTALPETWPLHGAKSTSVELRTPGSFDNNEQQALYWAAWVDHFEQKGWRDRLFLYLWDEPVEADFGKVLQRGRAALQADPQIRNLVTVPFNSELADVVQIWVPLVNCLERKSDVDNYCAATPPLDAYSNEIQLGKSVWFYQSCASHGCNAPGGDYFSGWPSYMIDASGTANRVMQWIAWKYGIEGELYYSMDEAYQKNDPWSDLRLFGGNGDGTLFYPGKPSRIGGHTDIPIESIRLKLIREGMEDFEYLALLAKLKGRAAADQYAGRIVKKTYLWEADPETFLKVRQELGETLSRLAPSPLAHGDAQ